NLRLAGDSGDNANPCEMRSIALESSDAVVAQAGRSRRGMIVNDVQDVYPPDGHEAPAPMRSELAVPLMVANRLLGVLDLHSEQANRRSEERRVGKERLSRCAA